MRARNGTIRVAAGALGFAGGIACSAAMILVALGVVAAGAASAGAGASGMAAMGASGAASANPLLSFLLDRGPTILLVSIALVAIGVATRRMTAAIYVLVAGAVMYWAMYEQPSLSIMYGGIVAGMLVWGASWAFAARGRRDAEPAPASAIGLTASAAPDARASRRRDR